MHIKVQYEGASTNSILNSGFPKDGDLLTFIGYSDEFKAKLLEQIVMGKKMYLSKTNIRKDGEWFEPLAPNSVLVNG